MRVFLCKTFKTREGEVDLDLGPFDFDAIPRVGETVNWLSVDDEYWDDTVLAIEWYPQGPEAHVKLLDHLYQTDMIDEFEDSQEYYFEQFHLGHSRLQEHIKFHLGANWKASSLRTFWCGSCWTEASEVWSDFYGKIAS